MPSNMLAVQSAAYIAACFTESVKKGSFQKVIDEFFVLNDIPLVKYPEPSTEIIQAFSAFKHPVLVNPPDQSINQTQNLNDSPLSDTLQSDNSTNQSIISDNQTDTSSIQSVQSEPWTLVNPHNKPSIQLAAQFSKTLVTPSDPLIQSFYYDDKDIREIFNDNKKFKPNITIIGKASFNKINRILNNDTLSIKVKLLVPLIDLKQIDFWPNHMHDQTTNTLDIDLLRALKNKVQYRDMLVEYNMMIDYKTQESAPNNQSNLSANQQSTPDIQSNLPDPSDQLTDPVTKLINPFYGKTRNAKDPMLIKAERNTIIWASLYESRQHPDFYPTLLIHKSQNFLRNQQMLVDMNPREISLIKLFPLLNSGQIELIPIKSNQTKHLPFTFEMVREINEIDYFNKEVKYVKMNYHVINDPSGPYI
ncbi:unnamed protein product [Meganyctiphanes norvegica]|uniref:Uncharacterized protein n=1 Tax=Meganyctiphanes norvegica TaxID=48144 RepID=A0AAV2PWX0_MEGNR